MIHLLGFLLGFTKIYCRELFVNMSIVSSQLQGEVFTSLSDALISSENGDEIVFLSSIVMDCPLTLEGKRIVIRTSQKGLQQHLIFSKASGSVLIKQGSDVILQDINIFIDVSFKNPSIFTVVSSKLELQHITLEKQTVNNILVISLLIIEDSYLKICDSIVDSVSSASNSFIIISGNKTSNLSLSNNQFTNIIHQSIKFFIEIKRCYNCLICISNNRFRLIAAEYSGFLSVNGGGDSTVLLNSNQVSEVSSLTAFFSFSYLLFLNCSATNISFLKGGPSILAVNVMQAVFLEFALINAKSNTTTVGIQILENEMIPDGEPREFTFIRCTFQNISTYYEKNQASGGAIFSNTKANISISNSSFQNISLNSSEKASEKIGGPCIFSTSKLNRLELVSSIFIDNHSRYLGNCIMFFGSSLLTNKSYFKNNSPIISAETIRIYLMTKSSWSSIMELHFEVGGSIYTVGQTTRIFDSIFMGNMGYMGGAIFMNGKKESSDNIILINGCIFRNNTGGYLGGGVAFYDDYQSLNASIVNCSFYSNLAFYGGGVSVFYKEAKCSLSVIGSIFVGNQGDYSGAVDSSNTQGNIKLINNTFFSNIADKYNKAFGGGSVAKILYPESIIISICNKFLANFARRSGTIIQYGGFFFDDSSLFVMNEAQVGSITCSMSRGHINFTKTKLFEQKSNQFKNIELGSIKFDNVRIENCLTFSRGGIFMIADRSTIEIINSYFVNISAESGTVIYVIENYNDIQNTTLIFRSCFFSKMLGNTSLFDIYNGKLHLENCSIEVNDIVIINLVSSNFELVTTKITDTQCRNLFSGCLLKADDSNITLDGLIATRTQNSVAGAGFYIESCNFFINNSVLNFTYSLFEGSCMISFQSSIKIFNTNFSSYNGRAFIMIYSSTEIAGCHFINSFFNFSISLLKGACIEVSDPRTFELKKCSFIDNNISLWGGALSILRNKDSIIDSNNKMAITFCKFFNNEAEFDGGAIFISEVLIVLENNTFSGNTAERGGAIFVDIEKKLIYVDIQLINNTFENNRARMEGGAIKASSKIPSFDEKLFINNSASYGDNLATYPTSLNISFNGHWEDYVSYSDEFITISQISSGNIFPIKISIAVLDKSGRRVTSLNEQTVSVEFLTNDDLLILNQEPLNRSSHYYLPPPAILKSGVADFYNFQVISKPNTTSFIKFTSSLFMSNVEEEANTSKVIRLNKSEYLINGVYQLIIKLEMRSCVIGEIYMETRDICFKCPNNKYSVLNPLTSDCSVCPTGAICPGGSVLQPKKGYWKGSNQSDFIRSCGVFEDYCLGYSENNCSIGYTGPLCSKCDSNYHGRRFSMLGVNNCIECPSLAPNVLKIVSIFTLFTILVWILIDASHREAMKIWRRPSISNLPLSEFLSIYLKILLNHVQTLSTVKSMGLNWPKYFQNYLDMQSDIFDISSHIVSLECLFFDMELTTNVIYLRAIFTIMLPVMLLIIFVVFLLVLNLRRKRYSWADFIICFFVINVLLQATMIKEQINLVTCERFENNTKVVKIDRTINCNSSSHKKWTYNLVYPTLAYLILIYPGSTLLYLFFQRAKLNTPAIRVKFGFFINGYKNDCFYWDFFIMTKKVLIILCGSILDFPLETKVLVVTFLALFSSIATAIKSPYISYSLNKLELLSNMASFVTIFSGVLIDNMGKDASLIVGMVFMIVLLWNVIFFYDWLVSILGLITISNAKFFYRIIPTCFHIYAAYYEAKEFVDDETPKNKKKEYKMLYQAFKSIYSDYKQGRKIIVFQTAHREHRTEVRMSSKHTYITETVKLNFK